MFKLRKIYNACAYIYVYICIKYNISVYIGITVLITSLSPSICIYTHSKHSFLVRPTIKLLNLPQTAAIGR